MKTLSRFVAASLTALLCSCGVSPSYAQDTRCAPRSEALQHMADAYGEAVVGQGVLNTNQHIVELFINPQTQSWTITLSGLDGMLCIVMDGQGWEEIRGRLPPNG